MRTYRQMPKKEKVLVDFLGWYGMVAILIAFALITYNVLTTQSALWQILNLTGSIGIAVNALSRRAMPEVWLNIIFSLVAISGLYQIFRG